MFVAVEDGSGTDTTDIVTGAALVVGGLDDGGATVVGTVVATVVVGGVVVGTAATSVETGGVTTCTVSRPFRSILMPTTIAMHKINAAATITTPSLDKPPRHQLRRDR